MLLSSLAIGCSPFFSSSLSQGGFHDCITKYLFSLLVTEVRCQYSVIAVEMSHEQKSGPKAIIRLNKSIGYFAVGRWRYEVL